jgi:hypothetical protein
VRFLAASQRFRRTRGLITILGPSCHAPACPRALHKWPRSPYPSRRRGGGLRQSVLGEQGYGHAANPAAHLRLRHRPHRTSSFASLSLNSNERIPINRGRERNVQVELPMQIRFLPYPAAPSFWLLGSVEEGDHLLEVAEAPIIWRRRVTIALAGWSGESSAVRPGTRR